MTMLSALYRQAKTRPDDVAFFFGKERYSYQWLMTEVERYARALDAQGVRKGDRVMLHMTKLPEMAILFYACFRIGAIAAPVSVRLKTAELRPSLERLRPSLYLGDAQYYPAVAPIDSEILPAGRRFVVGTVDDPGAKPWSTLFEGRNAEKAFPDLAPDSPAVLQATSGTTGQPKFVMHSQATLLEAAKSFGQMHLSNKDIVVNPFPMIQPPGLAVFDLAIEHGAPVVLFELFDAAAMLDAIEMHRATWFGAMPSHYGYLVEAQQARPRDVSSLKFCYSAGDVLSPETEKQFEGHFGLPVRSFWAATETIGASIHGLQSGGFRSAASSKIRLVDDHDQPVPRGEPGEMLINSPSLALGYWMEAGRVNPIGVDGWYRTGDMVRQGEADDEYVFVSRKKHLIIRGGTNIAPAEVEHVLAAHPMVRDAAIIGVPDPILGQRLAGFVNLKDDDVPSSVLRDILAAAAEQLADYKLPERLTIVPAIPRNGSGKIDRNALELIAMEREPDLFVA
jgi:acyl-coenzyme A synthetase/AMP-(fatty) acid ligase